MQSMDFSKEMYHMLDLISEQQEVNLRMCTTLVAGFIATNERDVRYMDGCMDSLFDCTEQQSEEEALTRKYIGHIATFNPLEAKERIDDLEDIHMRLVMSQKNYMQGRWTREEKTILRHICF